MSTDTYNGWTNYATWRVNLEMFDGMSLLDVGFNYVTPKGTYDVYDVAKSLESLAEDMIFETTQEGFGRDYALAFIAQVDFDQIAQHMIEDYQG